MAVTNMNCILVYVRPHHCGTTRANDQIISAQVECLCSPRVERHEMPMELACGKRDPIQAAGTYTPLQKKRRKKVILKKEGKRSLFRVYSPKNPPSFPPPPRHKEPRVQNCNF